MEVTFNKIRNFTDLDSWKQAHELVITIYKLTDKFPNKEMYSLVDQMKRSVVSISSNISEGFSRQTKKEKLQFYYTAKGSLTELQNQVLISKDVGYINDEELSNTLERLVRVHKLINGLIKSSASKN